MPGPSRPGRGGGAGVGGAELAGQRVELVQRHVHPAQLHRQCVCRVVARVHQQAVQQLVDGVGAALVDADSGAFGVGVLGGAGDHLADAHLVDRLHRHQHLDDAGRPVPPVRILGGDHVAGVQIGDQPRLGGDVVGQRQSVRRDDHAAPAQRVAAGGFGRHRQRLWRVTGDRDLGFVDGGRRGHPVRARRGVRRCDRLGGRDGHAGQRRKPQQKHRRDRAEHAPAGASSSHPSTGQITGRRSQQPVIDPPPRGYSGSGYSRRHASESTWRSFCSISSNTAWPLISGGANCTTESPRSSARQ